MGKFGKEEQKNVIRALKSNDLFYFKGKMTKELISTIQHHFKMHFAAPMSSGSAALHCAIGALEIPPGYEIITSPITDIGTLIGLLYQNLVPIFADVDPHTYNITAASIAEKITERTRAIIVVHLAGNPAEMDEIMNLAHQKGLPVIEDCAQSYGAYYKGKHVGTIGDLGCFSLNAYKHINAGDGGFVITNNEQHWYKVQNFADKYYDRLGKDIRLGKLAPNYRITELQSAVAIAQFGKVDEICQKRNKIGQIFNDNLRDISGIFPHHVFKHNQASYWFSLIRIDPQELQITTANFVKMLQKAHISASQGYIPQPIYLEPMFIQKSFFPGNIWPAEIIAGQEYIYHKGLCPIAEEVLATSIRILIHENLTENEIKKTAEKIKQIATSCR